MEGKFILLIQIYIFVNNQNTKTTSDPGFVFMIFWMRDPAKSDGSDRIRGPKTLPASIRTLPKMLDAFPSILSIKKFIYLCLQDSGTYECQINTEPKRGRAFHLDVVISQVSPSAKGSVSQEYKDMWWLIGIEPDFWGRGPRFDSGISHNDHCVIM